MSSDLKLFFSEAKRELKRLFTEKLKNKEYQAEGRIDQIIGRMFPVFNHTIMVLGRKR